MLVPRPGSRVDVDASPVPGHDTLRDAEAQARARDLEGLRVGAAEELREQPCLVLR